MLLMGGSGVDNRGIIDPGGPGCQALGSILKVTLRSHHNRGTRARGLTHSEKYDGNASNDPNGKS